MVDDTKQSSKVARVCWAWKRREGEEEAVNFHLTPRAAYGHDPHPLGVELRYAYDYRGNIVGHKVGRICKRCGQLYVADIEEGS